jgi:hypothetical protein
MGHSNSNSNPNYLNHHGPKPNTHTTHRPTCAQPSPPPFLLFSPTDAASWPTGHGPAQPTSLTVSRPLIFCTGQLTSGTRLTAFPSSSRCARSALPRSALAPLALPCSGPRQRSPTTVPLFPFSLPPRPRSLASPPARARCSAPRQESATACASLFHLTLTAARLREALAALRHRDAATHPGTDAKNPRRSRAQALAINPPRPPRETLEPWRSFPSAAAALEEEKREEEEEKRSARRTRTSPPEHLHHTSMMTMTKPPALHGPDPPAPACHHVRSIASEPLVSLTAVSPYPF